MSILLNKLFGSGEVEIVEMSCSQARLTKHTGWVRVNDLWKFEKYVNGCKKDCTDSLSEVRADITEECNIQIKGACLPMAFCAILLTFDRFPLFVITAGSLYGVLRIARSAVRLGKKLTNHINDKEAHKEGNIDGV